METLKDKWASHKNKIKLVNPANKRKYHIIVVGTGLAGSSAAASFAELGYNVEVFCIQDSLCLKVVVFLFLPKLLLHFLRLE